MFLFKRKKFAYEDKPYPLPPPWWGGGGMARPPPIVHDKLGKHLPRNSFHFVNVMLFGCLTL